MKKTLISLSCLIVAIGLAVSVKTAHEQNLSIQLLDANVEALSDDEGGLAREWPERFGALTDKVA